MPTSVIVPVLNEEKHLESLLQTLYGTETIIVDGGSTDRSTSLAQKFNVTFLSSAKGRAQQMNTASKQASGEVLIFLHADTRLPIGWREMMADFSNSNNAWGRFDVKFDQQSAALWIIAKMMNWRSRISGICTGDQAIFIRREVFERINGFADIPLMEDIEISRRLRMISKPYCVTCEVVTSGRRWRENGVLRTVLLMWWLRLQYFWGVSPEKLVKRYYS